MPYKAIHTGLTTVEIDYKRCFDMKRQLDKVEY